MCALLAGGAEVDARDVFGDTPLRGALDAAAPRVDGAAVDGAAACAAALLRHGARVEACGDDEASGALRLLHAACAHRALAGCLPLALAGGAPAGQPLPRDQLRRTPLHVAAVRGAANALAALLAAGADPNTLRHSAGYSAQLLTPLHDAATGNHAGCVRALLAAGAHRDGEAAQRGGTPLQRAFERGALDAAAALLEAGASLAMDCSVGYPELQPAVEVVAGDAGFGVAPLATWWPEQVLPHPTMGEGTMTLLQVAAACGHAACVRHLLRRGMLPWPQGPRDDSPLHLACAGGHVAAAAALLHALRWEQRRYDFQPSRRYGFQPSHATPLHVAALKGHLDCVRLLLAAGWDADAAIGSGWTPLHAAAHGGSAACAAALLAAGAEVEGEAVPSPLARAAAAGRRDVALLLLWRGADAGRAALHRRERAAWSCAERETEDCRGEAWRLPAAPDHCQVQAMDDANDDGARYEWGARLQDSRLATIRCMRPGAELPVAPPPADDVLDAWRAGLLRAWSVAAHALLPAAVRHDVAAMLLATLGSGRLAGGANPLRVLQGHYVLQHICTALIAAHLGCAPP